MTASVRRWRQRAPAFLAPWLAFRDDRDGAIAVLFALIAVPIMGIALTALDYSRAESVKAKLQTAVDNAANAAAQHLGEPFDDVDLTVRNYLKANLTVDLQGVPYDITIAPEYSAISVSMKSRVPTTLLSFVGVRTLDVAVAATVKRPSPVEAVPDASTGKPHHGIDAKEIQKKFNLDHEPSEAELRQAEAQARDILQELERQGVDLPPEVQQMLGQLR